MKKNMVSAVALFLAIIMLTGCGSSAPEASSVAGPQEAGSAAKES